MGQHKTRNIVLGVLAGGAALWGLNQAFNGRSSTATTQSSYGGGGHGFFYSHFGGWGGGGNSHAGSSSSVSRGGFGSSGSHGAS